MSMLRDLKKSLGDLSDEELTNLVTKVRAERRTSSRKIATVKATKTATNPILNLDNMSDSDLEELRKLLGE